MNPYLTTEKCVERLYKEYLKHPKLIIGVDYDDSISNLHNIPGATYEELHALLKEAKSYGFYIVVHTAANKDRWPAMIDFYIDKLGFAPDSFNSNPIPLPYGNNGKPYCNLFLDDRAGLGQSQEILAQLLKQVKIYRSFKKVGDTIINLVDGFKKAVKDIKSNL